MALIDQNVTWRKVEARLDHPYGANAHEVRDLPPDFSQIHHFPLGCLCQR